MTDEPKVLKTLDCTAVEVGDIVHRMLSGIVPMDLIVTKVDDTLIHCLEPSTEIGGWTFDRATGVEIDEELGLPEGMVASILIGWDKG